MKEVVEARPNFMDNNKECIGEPALDGMVTVFVLDSTDQKEKTHLLLILDFGHSDDSFPLENIYKSYFKTRKWIYLSLFLNYMNKEVL